MQTFVGRDRVAAVRTGMECLERLDFLGWKCHPATWFMEFVSIFWPLNAAHHDGSLRLYKFSERRKMDTSDWHEQDCLFVLVLGFDRVMERRLNGLEQWRHCSAIGVMDF